MRGRAGSGRGQALIQLPERRRQAVGIAAWRGRWPESRLLGRLDGRRRTRVRPKGLSASQDRWVHSWPWRVGVGPVAIGAVCTRRNPQASIRHRAGGKGRMPMLAQIRSGPQAAGQRGSRGRHATATTVNRPPGQDFSYGLPLVTDIGLATAIGKAQGGPRRPLCVVGEVGLARLHGDGRVIGRLAATLVARAG